MRKGNIFSKQLSPARIYLIKINRDTRKRCEICSDFTIQTPEPRQLRRSGWLILNILCPFFQKFQLLTTRMHLLAGTELIHSWWSKARRLDSTIFKEFSLNGTVALIPLKIVKEATSKMKNGSDLSRTVAGILKASEGTDTKRLIEQTELANAMTKR